MDILLESSTKKIVESPEEFLQTFSAADFRNVKLINEIKKLIKSGKRIGDASAVGEIYEISPELVVKISKYCVVNSPELLSQLCRMAMEGDYIFRIPDTLTDKTTVFAPNYILEPLIGSLLMKALNGYTNSFIQQYNFAYDYLDVSKPVYTILEKLNSINDYITDVNTYLYFIFQITHAIDVSQSLLEFTHYDLHTGNILARPRISEIHCYPLKDGRFVYSLMNFDAVIIDYGHARMMYENMVLSPKLIFAVAGDREKLDYYFFNKYYDLFSLLYTNALKVTRTKAETKDINMGGEIGGEIGDDFIALASTPDSHTGNPKEGFTNWKNIEQDGLKLNIRLMSDFLNCPKDVDVREFLDNFLTNPGRNWRPIPENFNIEVNIDSDNWIRASTPGEMLIKIVNLIEEEQILQNLIPPTNKQEAEAYLLKNKLLVTNFQLGNSDNVKVFPPAFSLRSSSTSDDSEIIHSFKDLIKSPESFDNIQIGDISLPSNVRTGLRPFNYTFPAGIIALDNQYIHVAKIDQRNGKELGYQFRFDCCRMNMKNYLEHFNSGICINAAFFNIFTDQLPIGEYKTTNFYSTNSMPEPYSQVQGIVVINTAGELDIQQYSTRNEFNHVLTTGPMLVWNSQQLITSEILESTDQKGVKVFQCRKFRQGDPDPNVRVFSDGVPNCDKMIPGELSHAGNPNPRSAICIDSEFNVFFVQVEGRANRGDGMDLEQLSQLCMSLGAVKAINLDGGRSSQLMWRRPGEEVIYSTNENQGEVYPVGSIIGYVNGYA